MLDPSAPCRPPVHTGYCNVLEPERTLAEHRYLTATPPPARLPPVLSPAAALCLCPCAPLPPVCCAVCACGWDLLNRATSLRLGFTLHTWALIHIIYIFSFEMNFNKTGLPSSNTSYKNRHICETLARTLRTIPQFPSSFWINNPEQHKPERLFLSSYASEQKPETLARTLRTIPQSVVRLLDVEDLHARRRRCARCECLVVDGVLHLALLASLGRCLHHDVSRV